MVTLMDVRHEIQKRVDDIECVDSERDTLERLLDFIDEGRGFEPVYERVTRYRPDTESLEDTVPFEMLALEAEVGL